VKHDSSRTIHKCSQEKLPAQEGGELLFIGLLNEPGDVCRNEQRVIGKELKRRRKGEKR